MNEVVGYVKEFCELEGYDFRDSYSGRGMYGRTCIGIVCKDITYTSAKLIEYLSEQCDIYGVSKILGKPCYDNMGLDYILYFPNVSC